MNNWLKIGLPILVAVLLVVTAVAVTLAVTSGGSSRQVETAYRPAGTGHVQYVNGSYGPGYGICPAWRLSGNNVNQGRCWGAYN
jgi:hypothetical protein